MPAPRPLSRSLIPVPGESLPGFLLRLSYRMNLPPARIADLAGLRSAGVRGSRLPPILVAGIPAPALPVFTRVTRLTDSQVLTATLFAHESAAFGVDVPAGLGGDLFAGGGGQAGRLPGWSGPLKRPASAAMASSSSASSLACWSAARWA